MLLWVLHRLIATHLPVAHDVLFWSAATSMILASTFLVRDLPELGVNTALVALTWLSVYLWVRHHDVWPGTMLGLAISLKCTPLLFLAFFVLKRQWRMAATTATATAVFTLSPVLVLGPSGYARAMTLWSKVAFHGMATPNPSQTILAQEKVENIALRPTLGRYLMRLEYGHLGRPETSDSPDRPHAPPNPAYVHFGNLTPAQAGVVASGLTAALVLAVAWVMRGSVRCRGDVSIVWQCATVSLLILLISPITWKQHCVGAVPALYSPTRPDTRVHVTTPSDSRAPWCGQVFRNA